MHMQGGQPDTRIRATYPYDTRYMVWLIAVKENNRVWEILLYALQNKIKLAIAFVFALIICFNCFTKTVAWRKISKVYVYQPNRTRSSLVFESFVTFLGLPLEKLSKNMRIRIIVCMCIWFTLIIRCSYTSPLLTFLKMRHYNDFIDTINDAQKHGVKFGGVWKMY